MKLDVLGRWDRAAFPRAIFPVWISQSLGRRPADNVNVETHDLKNQLGGEQLKVEAASEERGLQIHAHTHQSTKDKKKPPKNNTRKVEIAAQHQEERLYNLYDSAWVSSQSMEESQSCDLGH